MEGKLIQRAEGERYLLWSVLDEVLEEALTDLDEKLGNCFRDEALS